jgi:branched-chain amino acid transport system permease protein
MSDGPLSAIRTLGGRLRAPFEGPNTVGNSTPFWGLFALVVGLLVLYPQTTDAWAVSNAAQYFALAFLALSLAFVWGYCGVLSFGQVAFFGVGGYAFGVISINYTSALGITAAVVGAVFVGTLFSLALGYFMFYGGVRDVYVTIITLVVALVLNTFMAQTAGSEWAIGEARLGGFNGMTSIPDITLGVGSGGVVLEDTLLYYALLGALLVTYLGLRVLVNSSFGMTMVAVREDEDRTATFGYHTEFVKLVVFTIGGALAALGGVFYASWGNYVDPTVFGITFAALPVVWVSVGGRESLLGAIGATLAIERISTELAFTGSEWALVFVGALLLFVIMVMPDGIAPYAERAGVWLLERHPGRDRSTTTEKTVE